MPDTLEHPSFFDQVLREAPDEGSQPGAKYSDVPLRPIDRVKSLHAAYKERNRNVVLTEKPELDQAFMTEFDKQVDETVESYASQLAKESGRSLGQIFHERSVRKIRENLTDMMGGIATELMDLAEAAGIPENERDQLIEAKLGSITDDVVKKMADARLAEYENSSPLRQFMYEKWNKWGDEGRKGKVKKGLTMAVPGAIVGIAAAPVAGLAFGAGVTGALFAAGTRSVGRGLLSAHMDQKANTPDHTTTQKTEISTKLSELKAKDTENEVSSFDLLDTIDKSVNKYRRRNRNRVLGGVGIAMTAGVVSSTLADLWTDYAFGNAHAEVKNAFSRNNDVGGSQERADLGPAHNVSGSEQAYSDDRADLGPAIDAPRADLGEAVSTTHSQLGREGMFRGYHGDRRLTPQGEKALLKSLDNYRVKSGDTIWDLSEKVCNEQGIKNPSVYEIDATKDLLLEKLQASGSADKFGMLKAGARLRL